MFSTQPFDIHIHSQASSKSTSYRRLSCSSSIRSELNSIESGMFGLFFFVRGILTNCCYPESGQPRHCLGICAQPHQRFNTYCFKLHQSLPPLPSHFPSSPGSFFSVSFYYFASSSFSPLTSLHIISTLVAFSSSSYSRCSTLTPLPRFASFWSFLSLFPLL